MTSVLLALASALSYGAADFSGGLASKNVRPGVVLLYSQLLGLAVALAIAPVIGAAVVTPSDILFGASAGLAGALGLFFLYRALATTVVAIASPTTAVVGALFPLLFGLAIGEQLGTTAWIGVVIALPAILFLSWEPGVRWGNLGDSVRRSLLLGTFAGIGFGLFFILVSRTADDSGLWPLAAARFTSITFLLVVAALRSTPLSLPRSSRLPTGLAGFLDMAANVFFLLAARSGPLTIAVVVTSLYPAPTVVLAVLFFREPLRGVRIIGLLLAVTSVALMSV